MTTLLRFLLTGLLLSLLACDAKNSWQLDVYHPITGQAGTINAADVAGKLLVINYWAEWCKPCIEEIPELNQLAAAEQGRALVLSVNFDNKQGEALQAAVKKVGITYPAVTSKISTVLTLPEISGLPTTLVVDEHGVLKEQLLGPQTRESLRAALDQITKQ